MEFQADIKQEPDDTEDDKVDATESNLGGISPENARESHCINKWDKVNCAGQDGKRTKIKVEDCTDYVDSSDWYNEYNAAELQKYEIKEEDVEYHLERNSTCCSTLEASEKVKRFRYNCSEFKNIKKEDPDFSYLEQRDGIENGSRGSILEYEEMFKWHQCNFCKYRVRWKNHLLIHFKVKHDEDAQLLCCAHCKYATKIRYYLMKHLKFKHDRNIESHQCNQCGIKMKRKSDLKHHIKMIHGVSEWFHCQICSYKTKYIYAFKEHCKKKHNEETDWHQCQHCQFKSIHKASIQAHIKLFHSDDVKWMHCEVCEFKTIHQSSFRNHKLIHKNDAELYRCKFCKFETKYKHYLTTHFRAKHDEEFEWLQCQYCKYKTKLRVYLKRHLKKNHNEASE